MNKQLIIKGTPKDIELILARLREKFQTVEEAIDAYSTPNNQQVVLC